MYTPMLSGGKHKANVYNIYVMFIVDYHEHQLQVGEGGRHLKYGI